MAEPRGSQKKGRAEGRQEKGIGTLSYVRGTGQQGKTDARDEKTRPWQNGRPLFTLCFPIPIGKVFLFEK